MRQDENNSEEEFVEIDPTGRYGRVCSSLLDFSVTFFSILMFLFLMFSV